MPNTLGQGLKKGEKNDEIRRLGCIWYISRFLLLAGRSQLTWVSHPNGDWSTATRISSPSRRAFTMPCRGEIWSSRLRPNTQDEVGGNSCLKLVRFA